MPPPRISFRLAACDPCREAKIACDHVRPVCSRCQRGRRAEKCIYREKPFKKKRKLDSLADDTVSDTISSVSPAPAADLARPNSTIPLIHANPEIQPNPGFLGHSSYKTIFSQLVENQNSRGKLDDNVQSQENHAPESRDNAASARYVNGKVTNSGLLLLQDIQTSKVSSANSKILDRWLSGSSVLVLLHAFSQKCITAAYELIIGLQSDSLLEVSTRLSRVSSNPLEAQGGIDAFSESFCGPSTRWETLSLFFLIIARSICDDQNRHELDTNKNEARDLSMKAMNFSDRCLTAALDLDCLNDLQLFVQYENFITHSFVDGDQSYASWRRLGDVASSIYALGYHEDVIGKPTAPGWLQRLRKSVVARAYSADKNVAIFLGRPPRISWRFFSSTVLGPISSSLVTAECNKDFWTWPFPVDAPFSFEMDTWWSAICARLKEDVLELDRESDQAQRTSKASIIEAHAHAQWSSFPTKHQLSGPLKTHSAISQERDFAVAAKLNHLHILFSIRRTLARVDQERSHGLVLVSSNMLSIIAEAMTLSSYLRNSGTSLMWKLVYYGLPAAGILCLYLLSSTAEDFDDISRTKTLQDLSIIVAQVSTRAFADRTDPNFSLLESATTVIQAVIDKQFSRTQPSLDLLPQNPDAQSDPENGSGSLQWSAWNDLQIQDFEVEFWLNMTNHPAFDIG